MLISFDSRENLLRHLSKDESETVHLILFDFQSIHLWTAIPLRPLTFVYGPNSSGKSAIGDALRILKRSMSDAGDADLLLSRSERTRHYSVTIGLSIQSNLSDLFSRAGASHAGHYGDWKDRLRQSPNVRFTWLGEYDAADGASIELIAPYAVWLFAGEDRIGELTLQGGGSDQEMLRIDYSALRSVSPDSVESWQWLTEPLLDYFSPVTTNEDVQIVLPFDECNYGTLKIRRGVDILPADSEDVPAFQKFKPLLNALFVGVPRRMYHALRDYNSLGPIRQIPGRGDLVFTFGMPSYDSSSGTCKNEWPVDQEDTLACWKKIAWTALQDKCGKTIGGSLIDSINKWLADQSFFLSATRLDIAFAWLIPDERIAADGVLKIRNIYKDDTIAAMVGIMILNGDHETSDFRDVGTGFSQVIPVLALMMGTGELAMVEQPELHLHPKLQGRLCDVLINAYQQVSETKNSDDAWLQRSTGIRIRIVESHSEHILLRLLRRIRESGSENSNSSTKALSVSDVAVIYFDPEEGRSWVHEIRIDSKGEFLDRWPKGFFAERDEDLFYELGNRR